MLLAALIKSIEDNLGKDTMLDIWIVDEELKIENIQKIECSIDPFITRLHWKKTRDIIPPGAATRSDSSTWPLDMYMLFFIPAFIPPGIEKVIFLDTGIINCKDLVELWQTDLGDNIIAAAQDQTIKTFDNPLCRINNYSVTDFPRNTKYFNSDVLLINVLKWRDDHVNRKALDLILNNKNLSADSGQNALNIVLTGKWMQLNPAWNHFATNDYQDCYNIHFGDRKPIYKTYNNNPGYSILFYHYLNRTAWKYTRPMGELRRYIRTIGDALYKSPRSRLGK